MLRFLYILKYMILLNSYHNIKYKNILFADMGIFMVNVQGGGAYVCLELYKNINELYNFT